MTLPVWLTKAMMLGWPGNDGMRTPAMTEKLKDRKLE
jgi:hypothetical protein